MTSLSAMEEHSETLNRLAENERHFHTIQAGVRGLASTWTLAAFASLAIVLKHEKRYVAISSVRTHRLHLPDGQRRSLHSMDH